jgi:hypothetical protein
MKIRVYTANDLAMADSCRPGVPLWRVVPTRDEEGHSLTDFMMLIPRLREKPSREIEQTSEHIRSVLALHREVVFADLNLPLNILWVSLRPRQGVISEIASAIRVFVPAAVLIAHYAQAQ